MRKFEEATLTASETLFVESFSDNVERMLSKHTMREWAVGVISMYFEIADKEARLDELQQRYDHLCALYDECYAEYADADSLYWETAEARGWV